MWKIREISIFEFKPENPARRMISDSLSYLTRYQEFKVYHLLKRDITIVNVKHEAEKWYGWWSITICMTGTNFEQTNIFPWLPTLTSYTPEMVSLLRQFVSSGLSTEFRCSYSSGGSFIFYQRSLHVESRVYIYTYVHAYVTSIPYERPASLHLRKRCWSYVISMDDPQGKTG